jgi:HEAT repeat protein
MQAMTRVFLWVAAASVTLLVVSRAADALPEKNKPFDSAGIERLLRSVDERNAYTTVPTLAMRAREAGVHAIPVLGKYARCRSDVRRKAAVVALGYCGVAAEPILLGLLQSDRDAGDRAAVVLSLGLVGTQRSVPDLLEILEARHQRGSNREVARLRENAAIALGRIGAAEAVPVILDRVEEDREVRRGFLVSLVGLARHWQPEQLRFLTRSEDMFLRRGGALLLGCSPGPESIAELSRLLEDESHEVRKAAALSFGRVATEKDLPVLRRAEADRNPEVREAVKGAIAC